MALWEYAPSPFPARAILFIASDEPVSAKLLDDPRYGWREFAGGGLEIRHVRGGHDSMFSQENAPALAAELKLLLAAGSPDTPSKALAATTAGGAR